MARLIQLNHRQVDKEEEEEGDRENLQNSDDWHDGDNQSRHGTSFGYLYHPNAGDDITRREIIDKVKTHMIQSGNF